MKKLALCLYGLVGHEGNLGKGKVIDYKLPFKLYNLQLKNDKVQIDVFMHSWSIEYKLNLINLYNPVDYVFEKPKKHFEDLYGHNNFNAASHLYTKKQSIILKSNYEKKYNFKYDWVLLSRFDVCLFKKLDLSNLDNKKFYLVGPRRHHGLTCRCRFCDENRPDHVVNDTIYFSSSRNMDILGNCFDNIHSYYPDVKNTKIDMHFIAKKHLVQSLLWSKVDYFFYTVNNKYIHIWRFLQLIRLVPRSIVKGRVFDTDVPLVRWVNQNKFQKLLDIIIFKGKIDIIYFYLFGWIHFLINLFYLFINQLNKRGFVNMFYSIKKKGIIKTIKTLINN